MVVAGTISGGISQRESGNGDLHNVIVAPSVDRFLMHNFSIGAAVMVGYARAQTSGLIGGQESWTFGGTGQLGYNVWFAQRLSLWPRARPSRPRRTPRGLYIMVNGTSRGART